MTCPLVRLSCGVSDDDEGQLMRSVVEVLLARGFALSRETGNRAVHVGDRFVELLRAGDPQGGLGVFSRAVLV